MKRIYLSTLCYTFLGLASAFSLVAQQAGSIDGLLTDPSGGAIPAAKVTLTGVDTGISRSVTTAQDGHYTFAQVNSGDYSITAEATGFKKTVASVRVEVNQTVRLDLKLELGAVSEQVEVNAAPPMLQTADSQVGGVVESKAISDLPLNGRNFTQLMVLMAGATEASQGNTVQGHYNERAGGVSFSVNGQRSDYNDYLIDGFAAKEVQHGTNSIEPIIDALQEFRVQTSNYSAEFGIWAGGQINAVIKSGTNGFHGAAWEFLRNNDLDANNFFNNLNGTPIAGFHRNQFGVAAGGPVILPKYDGRNRTFIFGAYEGTRIVKGITQLTTVPTAAQRAGDFNGVGIVKDPFTGQPFPGDVVPASRINSITNTILQKWVPLPNTSSGLANYISTFPQTLSTEQYNWRIDHRFSDKDFIFGHYLFEDNNFGIAKLFPTDGASQKLRGQNFTEAWNHTFGPTALNEFRLGYSRFRENEFQARAGKENVVQELGMTGLCTDPLCWGIPQMSPTGFASFGEHGGQNVSGPRGWRNEIFEFQDSFYKTIGSHSLKMGGTVDRHHDTFPEAIYPRGSYSYTGAFSGQSFGDYLLGIPFSTTTSIDIFDPNFRNTEVQPWISDDWRVTKSLTINLGLRYEWEGRPYSKYNTISNVVLQNNTATLVDAKNPGNLPRALVYDRYGDIAPRVGFAWNPQFGHGRTVVRGAYGIFYQRELSNTWIDIAINPPFIRQAQITLNSDPTSPFYFGKYNLSQPTALGGSLSSLVYAIDPNWKDTSVQQWNFNIQQDLGYNTVLQVAYLGNHDTHLARESFPNQPLPGPGAVQPRRPYQNFGTIYWFDSGGDANYNSLQVQLEKRYSNGLQFISAYTYSKCIDNTPGTAVGEAGVRIQNNYAFNLNRGLCSQDVRQRYSLSFVYDLPFGRGRKFGASMSRAADLIAGGWQVTGIATFRSGQPFTVTLPTDVSNTADTSTWPNLLSNPNSVSGRSIYQWFNRAAFASPQAYTFGNEGRNVVIGPGVNNWDLSLFKVFHFDEKRQLQYRAEFFNAFNHAQFALPGATYGTAQFGQISATSHDPRDVQMSLKFLW